MKKLLIKTIAMVKEASLFDNETAAAIWEALPIEATVNRWGDEIYFEVPVDVTLSADARSEMVVGDLAPWHCFLYLLGTNARQPGI